MATDFNDDKYRKKLAEFRSKEAEDLARILANKYGLPYIDLSKSIINTDALSLIPEEKARKGKMAAFKSKGKELSLATLNPNTEEVQSVIKDLQEQKNYRIAVYLTSENSLKRAWEYYQEISDSEKTEAGMINISDDRIDRFLNELNNLKDIKDKLETEISEINQGKGISAILEMILSGSLTTDASDVHIEPEEDHVRLRYRLDGVLQNVASIPNSIYRSLLSRIKLVSGLKLNIKESAQDGRFSIKVAGSDIEIRTSILPGSYGESIVMRILNPKAIAVTFENLGVEDHLFKIFDREIKKPNGLILLTGPTGSGKTTTLYAFLKRINSPENKIITIEDPIEYHLEGVNQTQVNREKEYSFLSGLRSALRQDPDVIMVGEIRDSETAKIAINASLTGHLVFSTLHTNNAAGAIPRLIDLGVNPKVIGSALSLSIAQRLIRKLCFNCKKEKTPTPEEKELLDKIVAKIKDKRPEIDLPEEVEKIWEPGQCQACHYTGYKGRQGVFEAVAMDESVNKTTLDSPSERDIRKAAFDQKILDMKQDGVIKVINGTTSLADLGRVVDLNEEVI